MRIPPKYIPAKYLWAKVLDLLYWSKVFTEGKGIRDKLLLFPPSMLRALQLSIEYGASFLRYHIEQLISKTSPAVIIENKLGIFKCRKGSSTDVTVATEGCFEREFTKHLLGKNPKVFVDVGANIGRYTIPMAKKSGTVVAIEADPENFKQLTENIKLNNLKNVIALERACWFEETVLPMGIAPIHVKTVSSLKWALGETVEVRCSTLDSILKECGITEVDLVKMDIEGAEKEGLMGMKETIANSPNIEIIFEAWNQQDVRECTEVLNKLGIAGNPKQMGEIIYRMVKG
jgi:FkbM family methyltransferase